MNHGTCIYQDYSGVDMYSPEMPIPLSTSSYNADGNIGESIKLLAVKKVSSILSSIYSALPFQRERVSCCPQQEINSEQTFTSELLVLRKNLIEYIYLPNDWDGYGGVHASPRAVFDALEFLRFYPQGLSVPKSMLSGSGTVGLYWDKDDHYASLEFEGDGTYAYLTDGPDGYDGDECIGATAFPNKLKQFLKSF